MKKDVVLDNLVKRELFRVKNLFIVIERKKSKKMKFKEHLFTKLKHIFRESE